MLCNSLTETRVFSDGGVGREKKRSAFRIVQNKLFKRLLPRDADRLEIGRKDLGEIGFMDGPRGCCRCEQGWLPCG
jgi:hypothetical protein